MGKASLKMVLRRALAGSTLLVTLVSSQGGCKLSFPEQARLGQGTRVAGATGASTEPASAALDLMLVGMTLESDSGRET